jgi:hypothetical protein
MRRENARDPLNSMKRSDNTEMDRLLRRYARLDGEALRATSDASGDAHLDADEMNAYAEGALSDAARSRYFTHLADCDSCRKLVTDLTLAASVTVEGKKRAAVAEASPSRSWRDWLAALFSPPVLRYGAPALALFAVIIVVAIVAMRANRETDSVAQRSTDTRNYSTEVAPGSNSAGDTTTTTGTVENRPSNSAAPLIEQQSQTQPDASATPAPAKSAPLEADALPATQENAPKPAPAQPGVAKDSAGEFGIWTGRREQEVVTAAPPPPPSNLPPVLSTPATAAADESSRDKREEQKKAKVAGKDDDETIVNENVVGGPGAKQAEANQERRDVGRAMTARPAQKAPRSRASTASKSGPVDGVEEKEASTETRSVGGRHFRKQGGAWVDTAYSSSRSTTNVARNSEQYRALVADEPGLRTITQQLVGEVIVVWKSRAYRFY